MLSQLVDHVEIEELFEQFKSLATSRGGIDKATFEHCLGPLGVARNLITERLFAFFDQDSNGRIDFSELVCGLSVLCKGTREEKIKYAFRGYDLDADGYITQGTCGSSFADCLTLTSVAQASCTRCSRPTSTSARPPSRTRSRPSSWSVFDTCHPRTLAPHSPRHS